MLFSRTHRFKAPRYRMWRSWVWAAKHKSAACVSEQPYPAPPYMVCYGHTAPIPGLNSMPEWYSAYLQNVHFQKHKHISCSSQCMLHAVPTSSSFNNPTYSSNNEEYKPSSPSLRIYHRPSQACPNNLLQVCSQTPQKHTPNSRRQTKYSGSKISNYTQLTKRKYCNMHYKKKKRQP